MPRPDGRYAPDERWPGVLRTRLAGTWHVVEAGLCSRTTTCDDPIEFEYDKNGARALPGVLHAARPVDALAIMLGTNDLKARYVRTAADIAAGVGALVAMARASRTGPGGTAPRVLVICPATVAPTLHEMYVEMFAGAHARSLEMPAHYAAMARGCGADYLDAAALVQPDGFDGIHLGPDAHAVLGAAVADRLRTW